MTNSNNSEEQTVLQSSRFLASTLHEMRTPIQTIIGSLELLSTTPLNKEQLEYARQIQFSANVLLTLANDVLDFTKIRSAEFKLESIPYNVTQIVEQVTDLISVEAFNKGLEIVTDIFPSVPKEVNGDPTRVQQIILNLLKNAVKFTDTGYIHITVECQEEDSLLFRVIDSGIGIPEESRHKLFKDFYQVDASTTRKYGGTGLGLSICKSLVTAMKGNIGVSQNPTGGSIFWFTLPCKKNPEQFELISIPDFEIPDNTRILVVDDNFLARNSFEQKLRNLGLKSIDSVSSGELALEKMRTAAREKNPYTICFIDMIMPGIDGWHLAADINADKKINDSKLFLVVPEGQMGGEAKMKMLNWFNGYLYKPVKRQKLIEVLSAAFSEPETLEIVEQVENQAPVKEENPDSEIARGVKILVAEDHSVNRKLITTFLKKFGGEVYEAEDGKKAVEKTLANPALDIIFMDIQMPEMNGIDAAIEIRKSGYNGVIVACTANNDASDFEAYKKAGMNDIIAKPFKSADIKNILEKWNNAFSASLIPVEAVQKAEAPDIDIVWDESDFADTIENNFEMGCQLVNDFIPQTESLIKKIPDLLKQKNWYELRQIGHTIKGSAASISAITLSKYAGALNKAAHEDS